MSDQNSNQPTVVVVPQPSAPAAPAPAPVEGKEKISLTSKQLDKRLAEERERGERKLLKELGIEKGSRDEILAKIKEGLYGLTERQKIEAEQAKALEELRTKAKKADDLEPVVKDFASQQFEALPDAAKNYIAKKAGDDTMARYSMIKELRESGMLDAISGSAAKTEAKTEAPKPPNPATTVATPPATTPATGTGLDEYQQWRQLVESGQNAMAASYMQARQDKIMKLFSEKYGGKK